MSLPLPMIRREEDWEIVYAMLEEVAETHCQELKPWVALYMNRLNVFQAIKLMNAIVRDQPEMYQSCKRHICKKYGVEYIAE